MARDRKPTLHFRKLAPMCAYSAAGKLGSLHSSGFPYERLFGIVSAQPWTQCGFWDWNPSGAMRGYGAWSCTKEMGNGERCFAGGAGVRMGLS